MNTIPLEKKEKEPLRDWLRGHVIRDSEGNMINHRIWFKNIFNPFLRSMGWVIVTKVNDDGIVSGYQIKKYNKN
jgi:hypothetical protein